MPDRLTAFWPLDVNHNIAHVSLPVRNFSNSDEVMPVLLSLAAQSDALRSLQTAGEPWCEVLASGPAIRVLLQAIDRNLEQLNAPADLEIVCGGLCTWRPKTREPLHSFIAASHDPLQQAVLDSLDDRLDDAVAQLRDDLGYDLQTPFKLPMAVTDLIVSGGEAAGHPKHFAYFLPEDEGVDGLPLEQQRTLYFRNVHLARYPTITVPLADRLLVGPMEAAEANPAATLMPWIRGHDHGHNIVLPETDYHWKDRLGIEPFMALQEALADAFAFLLCTSKPWLEIAGATREEFCVTQLAELLHYMRRGPQYFGDPGAMYIELGFLAENGYVTIDTAGVVHWSYDDLCEGMAALAGALIRVTAGAKDERPAEDFLARHGYPAQTPAKMTLIAMQDRCGDVPTSLAFLP